MSRDFYATKIHVNSQADSTLTMSPCETDDHRSGETRRIAAFRRIIASLIQGHLGPLDFLKRNHRRTIDVSFNRCTVPDYFINNLNTSIIVPRRCSLNCSHMRSAIHRAIRRRRNSRAIIVRHHRVFIHGKRGVFSSNFHNAC
jgi:hypothetical protein